MAEAKSWADIAQSEGARRSKGNINNLRLESGKEYTVRFIGAPVKFFKYFVAGKSAITEFNDESCIIRRKYNIEPAARFAVHVIDRAEPNKIKILEVPGSVLKNVLAWWRKRNIDPGGDNGCDFAISVTGKQKNTRYEVLPLDITELTAEERKAIADEIGSLDKAQDRLSKLFKPVPQNEIENRLFGTGGNEKGPAQSNSAPAPTAAQGAKTGWSEPPF